MTASGVNAKLTLSMTSCNIMLKIHKSFSGAF